MKQKRNCANCVRGKSIAVNNDILCSLKGPVSIDYVCSKHKFAPEPKSYKDLNLKCIDCENFILAVDVSGNNASVGLCQMFSVRQYDGNQKNACSKFVKCLEREVS